MSLVDRYQLGALAVFYALFLGRTLLLRQRGTRVIVLGAGKRGVRAWLEIGFMFGLVFWSYEVAAGCLPGAVSLLPRFMQMPLFDSRLATALGVGAIGLGLVIFVLALASFGGAWRVGIDHRAPGPLVTGGVFACSRNPIFVFMDLYFVGTALIQRNAFFLLAAMVAVAGIHFQIREEERFLAGQYGEAYAAYRRTVRRYI